jgi:hypothetical protein
MGHPCLDAVLEVKYLKEAYFRVSLVQGRPQGQYREGRVIDEFERLYAPVCTAIRASQSLHVRPSGLP